MRNTMRRVITGVFTAAAVTGLISIVSTADTYTDSNGDEFTYAIEKSGVNIPLLKTMVTVK